MLTNLSCYIKYSPDVIPVLTHPLLRSNNLNRTESILSGAAAKPPPPDNKPEFLDPLGVCVDLSPLQIDEPDISPNKSSPGPLDNTLQDDSGGDSGRSFDPEFAGIKHWNEYRRALTSFYHADDLIQIQTSFGRQSNVQRKGGKPQLNGERLTEKECILRFKSLSNLLHSLWAEESRIDCIRLCCEVSSFLGQTSTSSFYPHLFALVTDFLDEFGELVYQRLLSKAKEERAAAKLGNLPAEFETSDVLEKCRMVARNWFGKVSEITNVIPLGAALMRCMKFMDESSIPENIMRLCALATSIPNPLSSAYARCYICRIAMRLEPSNRAPFWKCLNDWMQTFDQQPAGLLWPALEYIVQCTAYNAVTYDDLLPIWEYCRIPSKRPFMLRSVFNALPPLYLAEHALAASRLLCASDQITAEEIGAFGITLLKSTITEHNRLPIMRSVWKKIVDLSDFNSYLMCCDIWVEFVAKYFTISEVQIVLENVVRRLKFGAHDFLSHPDAKDSKGVNAALNSIIQKTVRFVRELPELLKSNIITQLLQTLIDKDVLRSISVSILSTFVSRQKVASITDASVAYQIVDLCKTCHDSLSLYSEVEEVDAFEELICDSMDRLDLMNSPEQALSVFTSARAATVNLDKCQKYVVERFLDVCLYVIRSARFSTTRAAFGQACLASAYITIPSLSDPFTRLHLTLSSAAVALAAFAYIHFDSFIESVLNEFSAFPPEKPAQFRYFGAQFLSLLLNAQHEVADADIKKFFHSVESYGWPTIASADRFGLLIHCLTFLYTKKGSDSDQNLQIIMAQLLEVIDSEPETKPQLSVRLLEALASAAGVIDQNARPVAKLAYKRCKKAGGIYHERMAAIRFDAADIHKDSIQK